MKNYYEEMSQMDFLYSLQDYIYDSSELSAPLWLSAATFEQSHSRIVPRGLPISFASFENVIDDHHFFRYIITQNQSVATK